MTLVPRDYYDPTPLRRGTSKQLARVHEQSLVARAAIEAGERNAAYIVEQRVANGYRLAAQAIHNATALNHLVTAVSRDNPGLEITLREIEATPSLGAKVLIYQYMTR
jgi:hypothetical protein